LKCGLNCVACWSMHLIRSSSKCYRVTLLVMGTCFSCPWRHHNDRYNYLTRRQHCYFWVKSNARLFRVSHSDPDCFSWEFSIRSSPKEETLSESSAVGRKRTRLKIDNFVIEI
jgi:hypothetical protein